MHSTANNPHGSTGPTTEAGKETSSRNAVKSGLFSVQDRVLESEAEEYVHTVALLMTQLSPEGVLEETFATEIMSATWRLRRCRILAQGLASELLSNEQTSIDRARAQSHNTLRRSIAELRKLQTERTIRAQSGALNLPGLTDTRQVVTTLAIQDKQRLDYRKSNQLDTLEGLVAQADKNLCMQAQGSSFCEEPAPTPAAQTSFCKSPPTVPAPKDTTRDNTCDNTPRNAPCPCGSGTKYKRCCGTNAPPVLNMAA